MPGEFLLAEGDAAHVGPPDERGKMPLTEALIDAVPGPALVKVLAPIAIALVYISLSSLLREPARQNFNAVFLAGAGAAYLSGGFGVWEFVFTALVTLCAFRGLSSYGFIGAGWLLHTIWDALHHLYGNPIVPFAPDSSLGCAICDPVIALWLFAGAPSVYGLLRRRTGRKAG
jgi:hypothetical protein